jgi:hypothetical protein
MPELSPGARSVFDAYISHWTADPYEISPEALAAALRAAADQVVPDEPLCGGDQRWMFERDARQACRKKLLAIADELEAQ